MDIKNLIHTPASIHTTPRLTDLPNEILRNITSHLYKRDIKSLRLTCKHLRFISKLLFERVFISANPLNLEVFFNIATHDELRHQVIEIVWDDTRLPDYPLDTSPAEQAVDIDYQDDLEGENDEDYEHECPLQFAKECRENLELIKAYDQECPKRCYKPALESPMALKECWKYYQELLRQQELVLNLGEDVEMLRLGLAAFPSLRKITLTPIAHRQYLTPRYPTPMIRAFPAGFNYPIPTGWPSSHDSIAPCGDWEDSNEKTKWRGFCVITRELMNTDNEHHVTEFTIDVNRSWTGLNCHLFDETSREYEDLKKIFAREGFKRIDLALSVGDMMHTGWRPYRSGLLEKALQQCTDLEHFAFHTNATDFDGGEIPLKDIFPIDRWQKLKHFGLSCFGVTEKHLFAFLTSMPPSIKTVELSDMVFLEEDGASYHKLLVHLQTFYQSTKPDVARPKYTIIFPNKLVATSGYAVWVTTEINEFLYSNGANPFTEENPHGVPYGSGGIGTMRQDFDPGFDRPNLNHFELMDLGYVREARNTSFWIESGMGPGRWFQEHGDEPRYGDEY